MSRDPEFGVWLTKSMARLRWDRADLAERMKTSVRSVTDWRNGKYLSEERKAKIRAIIDSAIDALPKDTFELWLHDEMIEHGWSEQTLAEYMGVSQQTISNWVRGKFTPSEEKIKRLRALFEDTGVLRPPVQFESIECCDNCPVYKECSERVNNGLEMMCAGFTDRELEWFDLRGIRDEMIWWDG